MKYTIAPVLRIINALVVVGAVVIYGHRHYSPVCILLLAIVFTINYALGKWLSWKKVWEQGGSLKLMTTFFKTYPIQCVVVGLLYLVGYGIGALLSPGREMMVYNHVNSYYIAGILIFSCLLGIAIILIESHQEKRLKTLIDDSTLGTSIKPDTLAFGAMGYLHQNPDISGWLDSDEVEVPFLDNKKYIFTFQDLLDDPEPDQFEEAIQKFLSLTLKDREETNQYIFAYYQDFVESVGEDVFDFTIDDKSSVWQFVHPRQIYVSRRHKDNSVYIQIAAECDWEEEHGLQIVYKEGRILKRVSSQDGHLTNSDAYAESELEDVIWM